jgi:uncharacterized membrane protein YkvI
LLQIYIIPGAVFEAITVGGGYGTGRETVEFFTKHGEGGGLLGMLVSAVCMGVVVALTFEVARRFGAYEYRSLMKRLIGRAWVCYEVLAVTMTLLVLAVTGAAAGTILADSFGTPVWLGVALMFALIVVLNFFGREIVIRVLSFWVLLLIVVFVAYFVTIAHHYGTAAVQPDFSDVKPGWALSGFKYSLYNVAAVPIMLYAARHIETSAQALVSGMLAAVFAMSLSVLFHLSFISAYPAVLDQRLPTHWMIQNVDAPRLMLAYVIVLFGALIKTCVGVVQGVNERLDEWYREKTGRALSRLTHAATAGLAVIASGALSSIGIVTLISRGYGSIGWAFLAVYVVPLLTVGAYQAFGRRSAKTLPDHARASG